MTSPGAHTILFAMSTALLETTPSLALQAEIIRLRERVHALEAEVARLRDASGSGDDGGAALRRLQDGWASMEPEYQAECSAALEEATRRSRGLRVDG